MNKQILPLLALVVALSGCGDKTEKATAQGTQLAEAPRAAAALPKVTEQSGQLRITTEPGDAQIFINGQRKGNSAAEPGQGFTIKLGEGTYTIDATKADGAEYEYVGRRADVFVADATMQSVSIILERRQTEQGKRAEQERTQRQSAERQQEADRHGYTISADGQTVTDKKTGLVWMRCSLGQNWNGQRCTGSARKYTWEDARSAARGYSHAGHSDWRLPSINELKTLTYCSSGLWESSGDSNRRICRGDFRVPTIVESAFPDTPSSYVWSGSPYAGNSYGAWGVDFHHGGAYDGYRNNGSHVRLVRGGQ